MAEFMTVSQVADAYGVTPGAVYEWIRKGLISAIRPENSQILIERESLDRIPRQNLAQQVRELRHANEQLQLRLQYMEQLVLAISASRISGFETPRYPELVAWMHEHGPAPSTIHTWKEKMPPRKYEALQWAIENLPRQRKKWHQCDAFLQGHDPQCPCSVLLSAEAISVREKAAETDEPMSEPSNDEE